MTNKHRKIFSIDFAARLTFAGGFAQVLLILLSWIVSTVDVGLSVRSLLSAEGIRWFFGTFAANVGSTPLVWLVLLSVAWGTVHKSGLHSALRSRKDSLTLNYRSRHALWSAAAVALVMLLCVILLTFVPHALLLGVTGGLWPSPAAESLVPVVAFIITSSATVYGLQSGNLTTLSDVFRCLYTGLRLVAPLFPLYIMYVELICSLRFVFGW